MRGSANPQHLAGASRGRCQLSGFCRPETSKSRETKMARMTNAEIIERAAMDLSLEVTFDKKNLKDPQSDKELAKLFEVGRERFEAENCAGILEFVRRLVFGERCRLRVGNPELERRYQGIAAELGATASEETIVEEVAFATGQSRTSPIRYIRFDPPVGGCDWPEYQWDTDEGLTRILEGMKKSNP
jgi:hypothetical protein